jgi:hypothetical protein
MEKKYRWFWRAVFTDGVEEYEIHATIGYRSVGAARLHFTTCCENGTICRHGIPEGDTLVDLQYHLKHDPTG